MVAIDFLGDAVRALLATAAARLPASGLGVVCDDGQEHVIFVYADAFGASADRARAVDVPDAFRSPARGVVRVPAADLEAHASGLVESRLLHGGAADEVRREFAVGEAWLLAAR